MNTFVTTYKQDYLWPYVKTIPIRTGPNYSTVPQPAELLGPPMCMCHDWSKQGPTTPLLDPKLYPARVGAPPQTETSRHDQPNVYMKKLHEKYPYLYNILQNAPPDDLMARVYGDRFRSTYQVDYCKDGEFPSDEYDRLLANSGVCNTMFAGAPKDATGQSDRGGLGLGFGEGGGGGPIDSANLPGDVKRPNMRSPGGQLGAHGTSKGKGGSHGGMGMAPQVYVPGISEYMDTVNKVGAMIISKKLHYPILKQK